MNHTQQSTKNSNFGQSRDRRCNLSAGGVRLYKAPANVTNFGLPKTRYVVPEVIITKNCRLHNQLFACNDSCGQRVTTIYCGPVYKF